MNKKFLKQLEGMKGKTFQYANQIHCLLDYKIDEQREECTIKTNLTSFTRKYESMEEFLKYWEPASSMPAAIGESNAAAAMAVFIEQETCLADKLIGILEDNISKVQQNKDYIPQAQAINNNINSIINISKMKLDVVRQMRKK